MAPSDIPRADGRRLEGERDGSSSRGTAASATAGLPAMAPTRSGAQGSSLPAQNPKGFFPGQGLDTKSRSGDRKIAERRVPKGNPFGADNRHVYGCGVGTRAPVAPSPALPAGPVALELVQRAGERKSPHGSGSPTPWEC